MRQIITTVKGKIQDLIDHESYPSVVFWIGLFDYLQPCFADLDNVLASLSMAAKSKRCQELVSFVNACGPTGYEMLFRKPMIQVLLENDPEHRFEALPDVVFVLQQFPISQIIQALDSDINQIWTKNHES